MELVWLNEGGDPSVLITRYHRGGSWGITGTWRGRPIWKPLQDRVIDKSRITCSWFGYHQESIFWVITCFENGGKEISYSNDSDKHIHWEQVTQDINENFWCYIVNINLPPPKGSFSFGTLNEKNCPQWESLPEVMQKIMPKISENRLSRDWMKSL